MEQIRLKDNNSRSTFDAKTPKLNDYIEWLQKSCNCFKNSIHFGYSNGNGNGNRHRCSIVFQVSSNLRGHLTLLYTLHTQNPSKNAIVKSLNLC